MGRRSPSPRRRRRSRSRERKRSRSRERRDDRKDRKKDENDKEKKSNAQGIVDAKKAMRESLKAAAASINNDLPSTSGDAVDEATGGMSRMRAIADIDADGFKQRSFKSSGGGAGGRVYSHKDDRKKTEKLEEAHESIIFGPTSRPTVTQKKDDEEDEIAKVLQEQPRSLFPAVCYEDKEVRQARWLAIYKQRRQQALNEQI